MGLDPLFRRASIGHDFRGRTERATAGHCTLAGLEAWRFDRDGAKKRHQSARTPVFQRPPGLAPLTYSPPPAMVLGLGLDEMALRLSQYLFSFRKRQANCPRCVFCRDSAAAEFANGHRPILSDQLQHNPPPHPTLQSVATEPGCTPPGFRRSLWHIANILRTSRRVERLGRRPPCPIGANRRLHDLALASRT